MVNASSFGFRISLKEMGDGNGKRQEIDAFRITVYHSDSPKTSNKILIL